MLFLMVIFSSCAVKNQGKHYIILSGQSNMELLRSEESFKPIIEFKLQVENFD